MLEKAIHITNLKNLKYFQKDKYRRLYWGVEFCQNLIPALVDTGKILRFVKENNLKFTMVTPFVTEQGLKRLKETFSWFREKKIGAEVVVNDWGVLECLNREFNGSFEIALGRLLVRQQRDPAMKSVLEKQPPFAVRGKDGKIHIVVHKLPDKQYQDGARRSYVNFPFVQDLLAKFGVQRVELNNLLQGLNLKGVGFKKSLYTPFVNISTGRFCPMETRFQKIQRINVCKRECQKHYDLLRKKAVPKVIYKRGNTTFYKNPLSFALLKDYGVDRIVFQP
ncbi:MAG: hypothetical protein KKC39_07480, partial [Candidatus Omnitrophica bacterium]|nr:hypothetical protein [Candidatus Omnitrophota bacterium]MCG2707775.1 hypothetical protein [Candidatus Omnitrophota bacterium]